VLQGFPFKNYLKALPELRKPLTKAALTPKLTAWRCGADWCCAAF
jgi:hypothetical protein